MEIILARPENIEQLKAIKAVLKALNVDFISKKDGEYDAEFVKKIQESRKQAMEGKVSNITVENLWN